MATESVTPLVVLLSSVWLNVDFRCHRLHQITGNASPSYKLSMQKVVSYDSKLVRSIETLETGAMVRPWAITPTPQQVSTLARAWYLSIIMIYASVLVDLI